MSFAILLCVSGSRKVVCREWFHYHHKCYVDTAICPFLNATSVFIATGAGTQDVTQLLILYLPYFPFIIILLFCCHVSPFPSFSSLF